MRTTLIRLAALVTGALASTAIAAGVAYADPDVPLPAPTFGIVCPPVCDVPDPDPEIELNCPPICIDDHPPTFGVEDPCTPDLCGPFPTGGGDEGDEDTPTEEPTPDTSSQPGDSGGSGGGGGGDRAAPAPPSDSSTTEDPAPAPDAAEFAPVGDSPDQDRDGGSNPALLAALATALGLTAGGGAVYAVLRRR